MRYLVLVLAIICAFTAYPQESKRFIDVNGTAEVNIPADRIDFNIQVRVVSQTISESKKQVDVSVKELMDLLKKYSISDDDIDESSVLLGKNYEHDSGKREQKGFFASSDITFKLKDLTKYYNLSDELAGIRNIEAANSNYNLNNYEKYNQQAYEKALKAAAEKASYMCSALDVKRGKVLEIDENNQNTPMVLNTREMFKAEGGGAIISGNVNITRTIRVRYEIE
jgi:uncharacterized protein YggE